MLVLLPQTVMEHMLAIDLLLNVLLNRQAEDVARSPYLHHSADLVLYLDRRATVGDSGGLGDDGFVGTEKLLLLAHLGCLGDFIGQVDQDQFLAGRRFSHALDPYLGNLLGVSPIQSDD